MRRTIATVVCLTGVLFASPSFAQLQRSFVASFGNDANNCQRLTPCRSFAAAYLVTNVGGEIVPIDSAGYGGMTIGHSLTVTVPQGVHAAVSGSVTVNAGASDTVVLDGLKIEPAGGTGISVQSGARVIIHAVRITGAGTGISVATTTRSEVFVSDTEIYGSGSYAANLTNTTVGSQNIVTFERVRIDGAYMGIWVADNTLATVRQSVISGRSKDYSENYGAILNQATVLASTTSVVVEDCLIMNWYVAFGMPLATGGGGSNLVLRHNTIRSTLRGVFGHPTYLTATTYGDNAFIDVSSETSGFATVPTGYATIN